MDTTEEEEAEIEEFLNTSDNILDLYEQGNDITSEVRDLRLPRVRTQRVLFIYSELKNLASKPVQKIEEPQAPKTVIKEEPSRPVSPAESHRCRCVHVVIPKKNEGLLLKDFVYLSICIFVGVAIYLYLYAPFNYRREPIY